MIASQKEHEPYANTVQQLYERISSNSQLYSDLAMLEGVMFNYPHEDGFRSQYMPFSLLPCRIKKQDLDYLQHVQLSYQKLLVLASRDTTFCNQIFEDTARNDPFVRKILELYNKTRSNIQEKVFKRTMQVIDFTIIRNDYLYDQKQSRWMMVEYNTIAAGLGSLSNRLQRLNCNLSRGSLKNQYVNLLSNGALLPETQGYEVTQQCMYQAWKLYGKNDAMVLTINQFKEKNIFDQRAVEYELIREGVSCERAVFNQVHSHLKLSETGVLTYDGVEVALVYLRAGFNMAHYDAEGKAWQCRRIMELSKAIVIPSLPMQLINFKRAQQELCKREVLLKYLSEDEASEVMKISTKMWNFEDQAQHERLIELTKDAGRYVLKPNREGGGNNIYGEEIYKKLTSITAEQRKGFVLMSRIQPSKHPTIMFKKNNDLKLGEGISEFGVFGSITTIGNNIQQNSVGGNLIRTKDATCNEGGIAAGFAALDSYIVEP